MATTFTYYPASPLSDCTNAIDNAENISSNNRKLDAKGQQQKPYVVAAGQNVKCMLDSAIVAAAQQEQQQRQAVKAPSPSSPMRHDPYSPCIVSSPMSAYESFLATYADLPCDQAETAAKPSVCAVPAPRSAARAAQQQSVQRTPEKAAAAALHVSLDGLSSTNTSLNGNNTGNSNGSSPAVNKTTVVKTVVRCNIDRTSGRPIPVRKLA